VSSFTALQLVTLLRLVSFMVLVYLLLGLLVEVNSRKPDSKLKAFFRLVCSPVTRPVSRLVAEGTTHVRLLAVSIGVVGVLWVVSIVLSDVLRAA
jgi:uncharacterized protein YggT (Ycf19 family)